MFPVYICDDDLHELNLIEDAVKLFFEIKYPEITARIHKFNTPYLLLDEIIEHSEPSIYLLGYNLSCSMNGLELSQEIRKYDAIGPISFISNNKDCWNLSHKYRIYAMNFISKETNDFQREISEALDASINYFYALSSHISNTDNPIIDIKSGRTIYQIAKKKIIYITSSDKQHIIDVYTKRLVVHPRDTLTNFINTLNSNIFFQCNRTSIINLNYIDNIDVDNLTVTVVKKDFYLSKAKLKELKNIIKRKR